MLSVTWWPQSKQKSKQKSKDKGVVLCLVSAQSHYFWSTVNVHYVSTIDFKVQFMQVYSIIQNYM